MNRSQKHQLHLVRAGLASGLLSKDEVIDWAVKIITTDDEPHIFFIDLALSSSKKTHEILFYFNDFLNFDSPLISGRPLLGFLYKEYTNGHFTLEQAVAKLFHLTREAIFNEKEKGAIYTIDNDYDCAKLNIYSTFEDVQKELETFLDLYKEYSMENFGQWEELDKVVERKLEKHDDLL